MKGTSKAAIIMAQATEIPRIAVIVLEGKGGVGKTLLAMVVTAMMREYGKNVFILDTDTTNSSTFEMEPGTKMADFSKIEVRGILDRAIKMMSLGQFAHLVMDSGARDESAIEVYLPWFENKLRKIGVQLVIVRPITSASFVQRRASEFAERNPAIPVVFACNLGQGRNKQMFERWHGSDIRAAALASGVVEFDFADAGVRWSDEANGLGLTLADVALANFSKSPEGAEIAAAEFDDDTQAWIALWLSEAVEAVRDAIFAAIANRKS